MSVDKPIYGVDISSWQRGIELAQVAREGYEFCVVKASEGPYRDGTFYLNPSYRSQVEAAQRAGMLTGAYHFLVIIEQLTSLPLEQAFQERIFVPLGMSDSLLPERSSAAIPDPHPRGYMYQTNVESLNTSELQGEKAEQADEAAGEPNDVTDDNPSWAWAAGAAISTLNDLRIWAKADATGELLSPQAQKERLTWVSP